MSTRTRILLLLCTVLSTVLSLACESRSEREERRLARRLARLAELPLGFHFDRFVESEGVPVYEGWAIHDLATLPLGPWPRLGAEGAYLRLRGQQGFTAAWVLEVAPGEQTLPERHLYDEVLYVLAGEGAIRLWRSDGDASVRVAWSRGGLLGAPLNALHAIENTGDAPLRVVAFNNAPPVLDLYRDADFVFGSTHVFDRGWSGDPSYFAPGPARREGVRWPLGNSVDPFHAHFVPDVRALEPVMHSWDEKNADFATFRMAEGSISPHVSSWAPESYQRAHRHSGGAMVLLLEGEGYFMMWPHAAGLRPWQDGTDAAVVREVLRPGSVYSPPTDWFHTHFNASDEPALYLAVTPQGREDRLRYVPDWMHHPRVDSYARRVAEPDYFIDAEDEDPEIRRIFRDVVRSRRD